MRTVIVEDFRAGSARPGIPHLPKIVRGRDTNDLAVGNAGDLLPKIERFIVVMINRDQEPFGIKPELFGHEVPGELDRIGFEVVAERKIAQHLEKRVVARGISNVVEIVVLAARPHALLRRYRARIVPRFLPREHRLELHHARVGEQQRRIVAGHQRRRRHLLVSSLAKVVEKPSADLVDAGHSMPLRKSRTLGADKLATHFNQAWPQAFPT